MSQTPTTPISPTPLKTTFFNVILPENSVLKEEISTIFVVGFPEDMQEREFQNMFMFSPGFEAATLKIPLKDIIEDENNRKQIIGFAKFRTRKEAMDARDILNGRKVDAEKGCMLKAEMAKKNLHTKRGLSNEQQLQIQTKPFQPINQPIQTQQLQSLQPLQNLHQNQSQPHIQNQQQQSNQQHQQQNQQAQQQQQQQQQSNQQQQNQQHQQQQPNQQQHLHLQSQTQQLQPPSQQQLQQSNQQQPQSPSMLRFPNHSAFEAFHSVPPIIPNELKSPNEFYSDFFNSDLISPPPFDPTLIARSQSLDARSMDLFVKPSTSTHRPIASDRFSTSEIDYLSKSTPATELTLRAMNSLLVHNNNNHHHYNNISPTYLSSSKSTGLNRDDNLMYEPTITRFHPLNTSLSTPPKSSSSSSSSPPPLPGIISPTSSYRSLGGILAGSTNPADQNPPCNTLYVGNLPANTNEEELKAMFSKCAGYKRLSFRNKSNGPMCFVEFEDAIYAAQALQELHGNPLSNSVKGGIRLSFSKNPLGVRQNNNTSNPTNGFPLMNAFNRRESVTASNFDSQLF